MTCYRNVDVRNQFGFLHTTNRGHRGWPDFHHAAPLDREPCPYPVGHPLRIEWLRRRAERGLLLHHPDDAIEDAAKGTPNVAAAIAGYLPVIHFGHDARIGDRLIDGYQFFRLIANGQRADDSPLLFARGRMYVRPERLDDLIRPHDEAARETA